MYDNPLAAKVFVARALQETEAKGFAEVLYTSSTGINLTTDVFRFQNLDSLTIGDEFDLRLQTQLAVDLSMPALSITRRYQITFAPDDRFFHTIGGPGWRLGVVMHGARLIG